jgi:hypothetical protein
MANLIADSAAVTVGTNEANDSPYHPKERKIPKKVQIDS